MDEFVPKVEKGKEKRKRAFDRFYQEWSLANVGAEQARTVVG